MYAPDIVLAAAVVALVLVFMRISWTLKEINETLASRNGAMAATAAITAETAKAAAETVRAASAEAGIDETEIAAVIAVAHAALREAV